MTERRGPGWGGPDSGTRDSRGADSGGLESSPPDPRTSARERFAAPRPAGLDELLPAVARGDEVAYEAVYDLASGWVLGVALKVVRDPAQAEEVMQEVLLDVWRSASRFDASVGSGTAWIMTLAHRRAVDRVRSERSHASREARAATAQIDYDEVSEAVEASLDRERVQRCMTSLTAVQRECVSLAYYGGYTYREVAELLGVPAGTVKTRMRDGLIKLRDCLGVQ